MTRERPTDAQPAPRSPIPIDDPIRAMIRDAGRRPPMPEPAFAAIRDAARDAWQARLARRRHQRRQWLAVAATLTVVTIGLVWTLRTHGPTGFGTPTPVATVALASNAASDEGNSRALAVGDTLTPGSAMVTGPAGRLALGLTSGASLRLAADSAATLDGPNAITLTRGALYIDTAPDHRTVTNALVITTPFGTVRDIGTQFTVALDHEVVDVAVREGAVEVTQGDLHQRAEAGAGLRLTADGTVTSYEVAAHGPTWSWVVAAAPPFELEGRSLDDFLRWVMRETGWQLRYEDPALAREATSIAVHGSIDGVAPDRALELILPTAGLGSRHDAGTVTVTRNPG